MEKIPDIIHPSWHNYLQPLFDDSKMRLIKNSILVKCKFYPAPSQIFRVFSMPLDEIRVVILGQDPYPNGEANGLAFAVNETTKIPASLNIIFKEIESEGLKSGFYDSDIKHYRTLEGWSEQGIFLLNTALTVEAKNSGSHAGIWQWFTRQVVKIISENNPCIWMLWGAKAQSFKDYIKNYYLAKKIVVSEEESTTINIPKGNYILEAPHPAKETYPGFSGAKFSGCNHFKLCNEILSYQKKPIINW